MELSIRSLSRLEPICGLSSMRLEELAKLCLPEDFARGCDPLHEIGGGTHLVFLLAGELKIVLPDGSMRLLVGGCDIANWPIGYKTILPISSKAITDVTLLRIDFDLLDIMMTWDDLSDVVEPSPAAVPGAFGAPALTSGALAQLPPAHIHALLQRFERIAVRRGEVIIREGEPGEFYYLIESGRCEVFKRVGGVDVRLAEFKAGEAFGEEALVAETRRNASVIMKTDGVLFRLAKPDFIELLRAPLLHAVDRQEAEAKLAGGACWLDVRYAAEFAENGLPGALNVPLSEIRTAFGLLDSAREYIVYCRSGRRSSAAAFLLAQRGFKAYWLRGGLAGERS